MYTHFDISGFTGWRKNNSGEVELRAILTDGGSDWIKWRDLKKCTLQVRCYLNDFYEDTSLQSSEVQTDPEEIHQMPDITKPSKLQLPPNSIPLTKAKIEPPLRIHKIDSMRREAIVLFPGSLVPEVMSLDELTKKFPTSVCNFYLDERRRQLDDLSKVN